MNARQRRKAARAWLHCAMFTHARNQDGRGFDELSRSERRAEHRQIAKWIQRGMLSEAWRGRLWASTTRRFVAWREECLSRCA